MSLFERTDPSIRAVSRPAEDGLCPCADNVIRARVRGIDTSLRTQWAKMMSTRIGYTMTDTEDRSPHTAPGTPLKYRSKHMLYISQDFNLSPLSIGADFRFLSRIERVDAYHKTYIKDVDRVVPAYIFSLRMGLIQEHFSIRLIIDNLLQYYYISSPANIGPPRAATLQLTIHN
ncbi:hypothetical protein BVY01_04605 [bacterium I07]|nr:hypothetical protein BVY01_04605 [bacterium I07]